MGNAKSKSSQKLTSIDLLFKMDVSELIIVRRLHVEYQESMILFVFILN
jgi:hypothetical protein